MAGSRDAVDGFGEGGTSARRRIVGGGLGETSAREEADLEQGKKCQVLADLS